MDTTLAIGDYALVAGLPIRGCRLVLLAMLLGTVAGGCATASPSSTSNALLGVTAPTDVVTNLPFKLSVSPKTAHAGQTVRTRFEGDLSGEWLYGADATLDVAVHGQWRTVWGLITDAFAVPPISMTSDVTALTVPEVGYLLSSASSFVLPSDLAPGPYRFCQTVARSYTSADGPASARLCAELTIS